MALEDILQKIEEETNEQIRQLELEYKNKIDKVKSENERRVQDLKDLLQSKIDKKVDETRNRLFTTTNLDERKRLLQVKMDIINQFLEDLKQELINLSEKRKKDFFRKYLIRNIESGNETIIISKSNSWCDEKFIKSLNKDLIDSGIKKPDLNLEQDREFDNDNGVIIKSEFYEIMLTIDTIIKENLDSLKSIIADKLFKK